MRKLQLFLVILLVPLSLIWVAVTFVFPMLSQSQVDEDWLAHKTFESSIDTRYFGLKADLVQHEAELTALHLDEFADLIVRQQFVLQPKLSGKIPLYLLRDEDWKHADPSASSYSFYELEPKRIFVNYDLGIGSANHEIIDYLLDTSPVQYDYFDAQGLAIVFEKTITFYSPRSDVPSITYGYLHPRRTNLALKYVDEQIKGDAKKGVERLLSYGTTLSGEKPGETDMVGTIFTRMLREGRLKRYVSQIDSGKSRRARLEAAFGKPLEQVWLDHVAWLRSCPRDSDFHLVDATFIAEGSNTPVVNGRSTRFDPSTQRWTFR